MDKHKAVPIPQKYPNLGIKGNPYPALDFASSGNFCFNCQPPATPAVFFSPTVSPSPVLGTPVPAAPKPALTAISTPVPARALEIPFKVGRYKFTLRRILDGEQLILPAGERVLIPCPS